MQKHLLLILVALCCVVNLRAGDHPIGSLSGTYLVGSSQPTYKKLTDVAAVLNNSGFTVTGNVVFELDSDYDGAAGETFPITFNQFNASGNWTVTIRPKAGVSMRTTSGNPGTQPLITLNGTDRISFDGRAGGTGNIAWLIRNTATTNAGATILLQGEAQRNTLTYLQLEGQTATAGVVHIGFAGGGGNVGNTISYCAIRDRTDVSTPARPANGILSQGSDVSTGNTFDHNNIFNFYKDGGKAYGIRLDQGASDAFITDNSIYQEQALLNAASGTVLCGISAGQWITNRFTIKGNFIGGSAPQCGGEPLKIASAANSYCALTGISYGTWAMPSGTQNVCDRNTIRNIDITVDNLAADEPGIFTGIYIIPGMDITNNTIGDPDGHDDIKITSGRGSNYFRASMIRCDANQPVLIAGNRMGGITLAGRSGYAIDLAGIFIAAEGNLTTKAPLILRDNTIGSTTISDNIRVIGDSLPVSFSGINCTMPLSVHCLDNTVAGVALGYAGTAFQTSTAGIHVCSVFSRLLVKNNLVSGISSPSLTPFLPPLYFGPLYELTGIFAQQVDSALEVSGNTIKGLHLTGTAPIQLYNGTSKTVHGIYLRINPANTLVYNNKIYDLSSANNLGASSATMLTGIRFDQLYSNVTAYNNLISLDNRGLSNSCGINGFYVKATGGESVDRLYHNTIYIGGSSNISSDTTSGASIAYSGKVEQYSETKATFSIRNNLLVNGRTGGNGEHYLFRNMTPGDNWTTSASDTNVLVTANIGRIGRWGTFDLDSTQWKTTGGDTHSWFYTTSQIEPSALFTDPATGDLSIKAGSRGYVTGKGTASTGVTMDFADETRSTTAPTIGVYEYAAVNIAPVITSYGGNIAVTLSIPENTTVVTTMTATDADGGSLVYSLAGGEDVSKFTIDPAAGILSFIAAPDFEQPGDANGDNAYIVTVQVSDGDSTAIQRFKIKVTDANDHAPAITSYNGNAAVTLQVAEHTTTVIATVTATDVDKNTTITYSLVNEEDAAKFGVNSSTGELSFITPPPDFEHPGDTNGDNTYIVTVKASDGDSSATQRFKIKLTNINDNTPVFTSHNGDAVVNLQVAENTIIVDTVKAGDADGTAVIYSIENGDDGALFSVSATGVLSFITAPDFDHPADANADNQYIVSVKASDGTLSSIQQFIITVTDLDDNPPMATMTINVPENTVEVTQLEGTDDDAGSTVVFTMMGQEDGALFWINPANGTLEFKTAPDFENPADADHDNLYLVSVKMTAGEQVTILRFKVKVTDTDGAAARATGRTANQPEVQSTVVLQLEETPEPVKAISIYPNPVTCKQFNLRMNSITTGRYTLEIYTATGQLVCRQQLSHTGKSVIYPIQLPATLARGSYVLKLTGIDTRHTEKLIIQ